MGGCEGRSRATRDECAGTHRQAAAREPGQGAAPEAMGAKLARGASNNADIGRLQPESTAGMAYPDRMAGAAATTALLADERPRRALRRTHRGLRTVQDSSWAGETLGRSRAAERRIFTRGTGAPTRRREKILRAQYR